MKWYPANKTLFVVFLILMVTSLRSQVTTAYNNNLNDKSHRINNAYVQENWSLLARLQKEQFLIDKNPSRLIWSARCYIWLHDTASAFHYLDTAVNCGYTNVFVLARDTAFASLKETSHWKNIYTFATEKYTGKERVFYWGYYYGIIGLIFVLNIFLFFSSREYSYLFLSLVLLADMHLELFNNSSLKIYINKVVPWVAEAMAARFPPPTFYSVALLVTYLLFTKTFLKIRTRLPRLVPVYRALIGIFICIIWIRFQWGVLPDIYIQILVALSFILIIFSGVTQWLKGVNESRHLVIATVFIAVGFFANDKFEIFVYSALSIGMLLAFTTLTLGISAKVKMMRIEKERAQEKAMAMLEEKVEERTAEVVRQKDELLQQKQLVEEKQSEILASIAYAKRLQQAILPPPEFINTYFPDNFILYRPKDIVAGDFYWAEQINDLFFIAAGDSTGHGVPGALVSVVCSNALNRSVKEFGLTQTGEILDKTKELVIETFEKSNSEVKDGMDISLLCIDQRTMNVSWSGANNPLWYVQNKKLNVLRPDKQPIGKTDNSRPFTTKFIEYSTNTIFYLFTDGYADQFGGEKGKKFNYKQFEALLFSIQDQPMQDQVNVISSTFVDWKGKLEQVDDVCVIGIRL